MIGRCSVESAADSLRVIEAEKPVAHDTSIGPDYVIRRGRKCKLLLRVSADRFTSDRGYRVLPGNRAGVNSGAINSSGASWWKAGGKSLGPTMICLVPAGAPMMSSGLVADGRKTSA